MSKDGWYRHAHKPSTKAHWTEFTESQAFEGYGYLSLCGKLYGCLLYTSDAADE